MMKLWVTRPLRVGWLRFTPESRKPIVTPCPFSPAPSAPAALVRLRCRLIEGSVKVAGAPWVGIVGGFTCVSVLSLATVGVNPMPLPPTGGGGFGRTLPLPPPPPPHAANASAIAPGRIAAASTTVHFAEPNDEEIAAYVATGEPLHVAGGFTLDGYGSAFVRGIEGDAANVIGLGIPLLRELIRAAGMRWTDFWGDFGV